jgi:hypothetical protein
MMRNQIMSEYTVVDGIIRDPGKFEGEPLFAPDFYESVLDGCGEDLSFSEDGCGESAVLLQIEPNDRIEFPELGTALYVLVTENEQGFVSVSLIETEAEAEEVREAYEADDDDESDDDDE